MDIPAYVSGGISFSNAFTQNVLEGFETEKEYDIDETISVSMPANSVFVFNGQTQEDATEIEIVRAGDSADMNIGGKVKTYDLLGRPADGMSRGVVIKEGKKVFVK